MQRRTTRDAYLGSRVARTFTDVRATVFVLDMRPYHRENGDVPLNKYAKKVVSSAGKGQYSTLRAHRYVSKGE